MRTHLLGASLLSLCAAFLIALPVLGRDVGHRVALPPSLGALAPPEARLLLVFAGFPGCGDTCPTTLRFLSTVYDGLPAATRSRTGVTFVNILADTPPELSTAYARSFHPEFAGFSLTAGNRRVFYEELGIRAGTRSAELAAHPGTLYLLHRDDAEGAWSLVRHYRRLPDGDRLRRDLDAFQAPSPGTLSHA